MKNCLPCLYKISIFLFLILPACKNGKRIKTAYQNVLVKADSTAAKGKYAEAVSLYSSAIDLLPTSASEAYKLRALCLYNLQRFDSAYNDAKTATRINPKDVQAYQLLARVDEMKGKLQDVIADYTAAIKLEPNNGLSLNNRGTIYNRLNQTDLAVDDFDKAIKGDSNYWEAYNNRALLYQQHGQPEKALRDFNEVIIINPKSKEGYFNRGVTYYTMGDMTRAVADWQIAKALGSKEAEIYLDKYAK